MVLHAGAIVFNGAMLDLMPWFYLGAHLRPARAVRRRASDRDDRAREGHPHHDGAVADHRHAQQPDFAPEKLESLEMILRRRAAAAGAQGPAQRPLPNRFYELYGLTEGFVTILDRDDAVKKSGSVGRPTQYSAMRIVREDGRTRRPARWARSSAAARS